MEEITPPVWAALRTDVFGSNALDWATLPDGRRMLINGSDNGCGHLWDIASGEPAQLFAQHDDWVLGVAGATLPGGQAMVATAGKDRVARLWSAGTGREVHRLVGHQGAVNAVAWCVPPNGGTVVATGGDDATVRLWDGATGRERHRMSVGMPHVHLVTSVDFAVAPDGTVRLAAAVDDGDDQAAVYLWDGLTGAPLHRLTIPPGPGLGGIVWRCVRLAVDPAGRLLVAANGTDGAHVWDVASGAPLRFVPGPAVRSVAWGRPPTGSPALVTAAETRIALTDVATGQEVTAIDVKDGSYLRALAVTEASDGALLVAAAWAADDPARVWRVAWHGR